VLNKRYKLVIPLIFKL